MIPSCSRIAPTLVSPGKWIARARLSSAKPNEEKSPPKVDVLPPDRSKQREVIDTGQKFKISLPDIQKSILGGRSQEPMNWNYPNKKLEDDFKIESTVGEILKVVPEKSKQQLKLLKSEIEDTFEYVLEKPDFFAHWEELKHNEAMIQYDFKADNSLDVWHTGCDSDWGQGYSKVELVRSERGTALFRGNLNTEIVRDGKTTRAGWASMKTEDHLAFRRKKKLWWFSNYSHLLIKCRGDGRSYKVMLYTPGAIDLSWGDAYSYPLHTHGGPYWQYEKIPFSRFLHTVGGRIQDNQKPIPRNEISSISVVLMDRMDGEFNLEIDYIGCYNDTSHVEKFAYETYTIPMFNTHAL